MLEMAILGPQTGAWRGGGGGKTGGFRQSQPRVLCERLASFFKTSLKHKSFKTARNVEQNAGVCVPFLEAHVFSTIVKNGDESHTLSSRRCHGLDEPRIHVDVRAIAGIQLKEFHGELPTTRREPSETTGPP